MRLFAVRERCYFCVSEVNVNMRYYGSGVTQDSSKVLPLNSLPIWFLTGVV